ncbi:Uma2 family endonuclease [Actinophytocola oryzae]|uniref:Uma2 family endonuclease n=1 Tax=Actinophytocola oryzae TaxID=502181 RepID=A0A4R7V0C2_9PSEU|nr:Uma2 family endonuclease [Actinophytocola oryzae]TDV42703.1 Uma2 family endonuclease [Actinophytocola oryzae]
MSVAAVAHFMLPDSPYAMWVRDELAGYLHLPKDGTRVEVIGGEIVVSPGPSVDHNGMVRDIERGLFAAELTDPTFVWRSVQTTDLNMFEIGDGYIPDLIVMDAEVLAEARATKARHLLPYQVDLVVEVTSRSNAVSDRRPDQKRKAGTKWSGYAHAGIPYYLLVDRDPKVCDITLYANPDTRAGTYVALQTWDFGETVRLPHPFGFEISTEHWDHWGD